MGYQRRVHGVPIFILLLTCVLLFISVNNIDVIIIITLLQILLYVRIYTLRWYHIMILLMILELILNIFLVSMIVSWSLSGSYFLIYCFVTLRVAEARVGISLLTILIRAHGRDYLTLD